MGYYASANLSYGAVLLADEEDSAQEVFNLTDEQYEQYDEDPETHLDYLLLKASGFEALSSAELYSDEFYGTPAYEEYQDKERAAWEGLGVHFEHCGSYKGEFGFYILCVNDLGMVAEYGPNLVSPDLTVSDDQRYKLDKALEALGVTPKLPVGWYLSASYG